MESASLQGGFDNPSHASAYAFRAAMEVMARPGKIEAITGAQPPRPMSVAAGTLLLTLCDTGTPLYLAGDMDTPQICDWVRFHIGAPLVGAADCAFAVGRWQALMPLDAYPVGTPEYPDRSATLVVECAQLENTDTALCGPGIERTVALSLPDPAILMRARIPLGLDFFLTCGERIAGLPRTTRPAKTETH